MTIPQKNKEKKSKNFQHKINENLFFDQTQEITLTKDEVKSLKKSLTNLTVDKETSKFFKSAHQFYKKLKKNRFIITLEEIEES